MWLYAARRIVLTVPILLGVTVICFALVQIAPGDPIQNLLSPTATAADAARLRAAYGLDQPLMVQYVIRLGKVLTGDLGVSIANNAPVAGEVGRAFVNTVVIALISVALAFVLSTAFGVIAAYRSGRIVDKLITGVAVFGISVPPFWLAMILVAVSAVDPSLLPATGMGASGSASFSYLRWADFEFAVMPIVALAPPPLGIMTRATRSSAAGILNQDFIQTLRAKGLGEAQVIVHAVRNIMPQAIACWASSSAT